MFFEKKYYLCSDSIGEKDMFIRKLIPCLIVIVSAVLLSNMAVADTLDTISEGYSLEKEYAAKQNAEGCMPFGGEITDTYEFPTQDDGCFSQSSFRIQSFSCDRSSEEEVGEFYRTYYNGVQYIAYKNVQTELYADNSGLQGPEYYVYALRRIII